MFLSKLNGNDLHALLYLEESPEFKRIASALKAGDYDIVFHYEDVKERFVYEAIGKEGTSPNYIGLAVDAKRGIEGFPIEGNSAGEQALALLLYEAESNLSKKDPEALKKIYAPFLEEVTPLLDMTPFQIEKRQQIRDEFLKSVSFIEQESVAKANTSALKEGEKLVLDPLFQSVRDYYGDKGLQDVNLKMHLIGTDGERYTVNDLPLLISAFNDHSGIILKKGKKSLSLKLSPALFGDTDVSLLGFLSSIPLRGSNGYYAKKDSLVLSLSQAITALDFYAGKSVDFDDYSFSVIKNDKQAGLFLSPDGNMTFFPSLPKRENILCSRDGVVVFSRSDKRLDLYDFPNEQIGELYSFFASHGEESFGAVKDIIRQRIVPHLGDNLARSALPKENPNENLLLTIDYAIDFSDQGSLLFKTTYQIGNKKIERESLSGNLYYTSLLFGFDNVLETMGIPSEGEVKDEDRILAFLRADLSKLKKVATLYLSERFKRLSLHSVGKISINISSNIDFLSLSVNCPEYTEEQLANILSMYRKKHRFFRLGEKIITLDDPSLSLLDKTAQEMDLPSRGLRKEGLPFYVALKLLAKQDQSLPVSVDQSLRQALDDIKNFKQFPLPLADSLAKKMRPYQLDAARWMSVLRKYHLSGILADDMGMGKTLESIAFLSLIDEKAPILVVSPKSVLFNWEAEFKRWLPEMKVMVLAAGKEEREKMILAMGKEKEVYVTSYDSLRNDLPLYEKKHFSVVLLDEGQYIKNAYAQKSKAVKELDATSRFALTGTPIENNLNDLWSIFDFLMPSYLGDYESFQEQYVKNDKNSALRSLITPFLLRRSKEEYLKDLPKKSVQVVTLSMNDEERALYDATLLDAKNMLEKGEKGVPIFALLTKLREICVDPSAFFDGMPPVSSKISYVLESISEAISNGHKVLLFSSFTKVLDHLRYLLDEEHLSSYYINGDTESSLRQKISTSFNTGDQVKILLVSLKAGGSGLNLQGADTVYHLDPWWNLAAEEQATDRAHRIGQTRPVQVFKLVCHDSIEEKVLLLQEKKKTLYRSVIAEGEEGITHLSIDDLLYLLS